MSEEFSNGVVNAFGNVVWREIPQLIQEVMLTVDFPVRPIATHVGTLRIGPLEVKTYLFADGSVVVDAQDVIEIVKLYEAHLELQEGFDI